MLDTLLDLNELRKEVAYGEADPGLGSVDLEELAVELERFILEVEGIVEQARP